MYILGGNIEETAKMEVVAIFKLRFLLPLPPSICRRITFFQSRYMYKRNSYDRWMIMT